MTKILLTRPREDSEILAREIAVQGYNPVIEPMMEIINLPVILPDLKKFSGLVFTSANGVRAFGKISSDRTLPVYAVGEATADETTRAGFKTAHNCGGTLESLNSYLAQHQITNVLHLSGTHIAGNVIAGGAPVPRLALYEGRAAESISPALAELLKKGDIAKILFYSPRTAKIFTNLVKKHDMATNIGVCTALCLSDSVVNFLSDLPWKKIEVAAAPDRAHILRLLDK